MVPATPFKLDKPKPSRKKMITNRYWPETKNCLWINIFAKPESEALPQSHDGRVHQKWEMSVKFYISLRP